MLTDRDKVELLLKGLNVSRHLNYPDDSLDDELKQIYGLVHGTEALTKAINDTGYPKRFHSDWQGSLKNDFRDSELSNTEIKEIISRVEKATDRNFLWIFLIEKAANDGDLGFAEETILQLPVAGEMQGPLQAQGHRVLLKYFASNGDLENYNLRLKACAIKRQSHIDLEKSILIAAYTEKNGWKAGLELVKKKEFGTFFYLHFITPLAKILSLDKIENIFLLHPELFENNPFIRELTYVKYFTHEASKSLNLDTFNKVFNLLMQSKNGTNHDWQFFDIAVASKNIDVVEKCKKVIRTPHIHRELKPFLKTLKNT